MAAKVTKAFQKKSFWRNNATRIIYPLLIFFKIIGLFTLSIEIVLRSDKDREIVLKKSKLGIVHNLIAGALFLSVNILSLRYRNLIAYPGESPVVDNVENLQNLLSVTVVCVTLSSYCSQQRAMLRIAASLTTIQRKFDQLEWAFQRVDPLRSAIAAWIANCFMYACYFVALILHYLQNDFSANVFVLVYWLLQLAMSFLIGCCAMQYYFLVAFVDAKFRETNEILRNMCRSSDVCKVVDVLQFLDDNRQIVPVMPTVNNIVCVRNIHGNLLEMCSDVNGTFSVPLLFGLTYTFFFVVYLTFYVVVLALSASRDYSAVLHPVSSLICLIYPIIMLMFAITRLKNKGGEMALLVHKLLNATNDPEHISQLKIFSLQLLHEKPQFTACCFFDLDCSLLHGIIGAVTMYTVILVQFQTSDITV